mgnify:CR=1 FL=1
MKLRHIHYVDNMDQAFTQDLYDVGDSIRNAERTLVNIAPLLDQKMIDNEEFLKFLAIVQDRLHIANVQLETLQKNVLALSGNQQEKHDNQPNLSTTNGEPSKDSKK